ncbi:MAG: hypothetical protein H9W80_12870 [Enterococcus sp.]|nr:hypothetical protein [Enterococcus sp.]
MSIVPFSEFVLFRPIFFILLAATVVNSLYLIFLQKKIKASYVISFNSFLMLIAAVVLSNQQLLIVSELNFLEDRVGMVSIVLIAVLLVASLLTLLAKTKDKKQRITRNKL